MKYNNDNVYIMDLVLRIDFEQIIWNFTKKRHFYFKEKDLNKISFNSLIDFLEQSSK
jgi:hypothetical protein